MNFWFFLLFTFSLLGVSSFAFKKESTLLYMEIFWMFFEWLLFNLFDHAYTNTFHSAFENKNKQFFSVSTNIFGVYARKSVLWRFEVARSHQSITVFNVIMHSVWRNRAVKEKNRTIFNRIQKFFYYIVENRFYFLYRCRPLDSIENTNF